MVIAVYPGSFDPATYGHLDIIKRASVSFDKVIVGVLHNSAKSPLFSVEERVNILEKATKDMENVEIKAFKGLSVNFARENHAQVIVRGLRAMKLVKDGGFLATCSCSHFMDYQLFTQTIGQAARNVHKRLRQVEYRTQAPDHPILWSADESYYLKFYIFQVCSDR